MSTVRYGGGHRYGPDDFPRYFATWLHVWPGQPVRGIVVAPRPLWFVTHWLRGRTYPHRRDEIVCEGCQAHNERRALGYLGVAVGKDKRYGVLTLSGMAVLRNPALGVKSDKDLRGMVFSAHRDGTTTTSPVIVSVSPENVPPENVPPNFNLLAFLLKQWQVESAAGLQMLRPEGEVDAEDEPG